MRYRTGSSPYKNLYIYHLEGRFREEDEKLLGKEFLGNWIEDEYSFLFFSSEPESDVYKIITENSIARLLDKYKFSYEEWQGGGFEKKKIAGFIIVSPWEKDDEESEKHKIILDPGVVFGNGLHSTTKDCLCAIYYLKEQYSFKKVLDIGTGTGILGIASIHLGADFVSAIDLNPLAVKTAVNNVQLNGFEDRMNVYEGKAEDLSEDDYDLVIANIHFDVIKSLLLKKTFCNRNYLILSGLMRSQARDVKNFLSKTKLEIVKEWDHDMTWYTMLLCGNRNGT